MNESVITRNAHGVYLECVDAILDNTLSTKKTM